MENRTYRMYGLVPYNISPIQQGIQFGHSVVEYQLKYGNGYDYHKWSNYDKTFIILNGGTTNNNPESLGSLNQHLQTLEDNGIKVSTFTEPDLGDQLTAITFLVDDRVFDKKTWTDYDGDLYLNGTPMEKPYYEWKMKFSDDEVTADKIIFLREFLKQFRFA
jgi:hypothetical protein